MDRHLKAHPVKLSLGGCLLLMTPTFVSIGRECDPYVDGKGAVDGYGEQEQTLFGRGGV